MLHSAPPPRLADREREERAELIAWWSEIFVVPCVAWNVETQEEAARTCRVSGPISSALSSEIWLAEDARRSDCRDRRRLASSEERRVKGAATFRAPIARGRNVRAAGATGARATESPSFKAYSQGQYMTARKLAETEAAQGSKEAYTLLGEIYEEGLGVAQDYTKAADAYRQGRRSRRCQRPVLARHLRRSRAGA